MVKAKSLGARSDQRFSAYSSRATPAATMCCRDGLPARPSAHASLPFPIDNDEHGESFQGGGERPTSAHFSFFNDEIRRASECEPRVRTLERRLHPRRAGAVVGDDVQRILDMQFARLAVEPGRSYRTAGTSCPSSAGSPPRARPRTARAPCPRGCRTRRPLPPTLPAGIP